MSELLRMNAMSEQCLRDVEGTETVKFGNLSIDVRIANVSEGEDFDELGGRKKQITASITAWKKDFPKAPKVGHLLTRSDGSKWAVSSIRGAVATQPIYKLNIQSR